MPIESFDTALLPRTRWKNGGGWTREIVRRPQGAGLDDCHWRASLAEIASDGAFSLFPGKDRVIVLLEGAGARLQSPDGRIDHRLVAKLEPYFFPGEAEVACTLLAGTSIDWRGPQRGCAARPASACDGSGAPEPQAVACLATDCNVMAQRARYRMEARVVGDACRLEASIGGLLLAARGAWATNSPAARLEAGTGLWWDEEPVKWDVRPLHSDAALVAVQIWPV